MQLNLALLDQTELPPSPSPAAAWEQLDEAARIAALEVLARLIARMLDVPGNITLMPLPAKAPELNPVENIWQYMRDNWLSNRVFKSHDDIVDHCCHTWNRLLAQPCTIMSIGLRDWTYGA